MNEDSKLPMKIELGASAKAEFKAEIKGDIPSGSMGRLVDALTDAIRPFTENRGLKADHIRLQREEVLIQIAEKARRRLELEGRVPQAIPNKLLVPLLEAASLEEMQDELLLDMWANLLAQASIKHRSENLMFVRLLKELNSEEALLFQNMLLSYEDRRSPSAANWHYRDAPRSLSPSSVVLFCRRYLTSVDKEQWPDRIVAFFEGPGTHLRHVVIAKGQPNRYPRTEVTEIYRINKPGRKFDEISFEILRSLYLIERLHFTEIAVDDETLVDFTAFCLTDVGVRFFETVSSPDFISAAISDIRV